MLDNDKNNCMMKKYSKNGFHMKRKNLIIGFSILVFSMMLYFSFMEKNKIDYKINTPDKSEKQTKTNKLINNEYNYKKTEILEVNTKIDKNIEI